MNSSAVEQIKERLQITDVLSSYMTLIAAGKQYKARCPFHNERTASFSISPDRGLYYCFGCGAKGDMFTFVQQFEGLDFNGALKVLAERAGVELSVNDRKRDDLAPVYECLEKATIRYQAELQKNNEALLYLKGRGLTPETISQFRLGYAPTEWRFIANACTSDAERKIAERAGLIKTPDRTDDGQKGPYDRFRGRIMYPLMDASGRVIGFSGRMFPDTPEGPKYLNSPETEVFQKSRVLYGFDQAKFHIKRLGFAIMVEGQMDLVLSHQAGFRNTVATSGTAVSEQSAEDDHANLVTLSRLSPHLFLAFDGDAAGHKALARAALVALALGMNPKVVPVPEGIDPADYMVKEGAEHWKALLKASEHFIVHQARTVKAEKHSPHMLVRALREAVFPYLSKVVSPIEQNLYVEAVASELGLDTAEVARELSLFVARTPVTERSRQSESVSSTSPTDVLTSAERFAAFAVRFPDEQATKLSEELSKLSFAGESYDVIEVSDDRRAPMLAIIERDYGDASESERSAIAQELAAKAISEFLSRVRMHLSSALRDAEQAGDEARSSELLAELSKLNQLRHGG